MQRQQNFTVHTCVELHAEWRAREELESVTIIISIPQRSHIYEMTNSSPLRVGSLDRRQGNVETAHHSLQRCRMKVNVAIFSYRCPFLPGVKVHGKLLWSVELTADEYSAEIEKPVNHWINVLRRSWTHVLCCPRAQIWGFNYVELGLLCLLCEFIQLKDV